MRSLKSGNDHLAEKSFNSLSEQNSPRNNPNCVLCRARVQNDSSSKQYPRYGILQSLHDMEQRTTCRSNSASSGRVRCQQSADHNLEDRVCFAAFLTDRKFLLRTDACRQTTEAHLPVLQCTDSH